MARPSIMLLVGLALLASACSTERVEGEYRDVYLIAEGECFTRKHLDETEWEVVLVIPCDGGDWSFVLLNKFRTEYDGPFPGYEAFLEEASHRCHGGWTTYLAPVEEGWRIGDRMIQCLAEPGFPAGSGV